MFRKQKGRRRPQINLSALIDVAFILVIFIVLGATFQRVEDIEVTLPEADAKSAANSDGLQVVVHPDGSVDVEGERVAAETVRSRLESLRRQHESVLLLADQRASVQAAVTVLSHAQAAGFRSVAIATQKPMG